MIAEQFRRVAAQYRDEPAIVDGGERVTYGELAARIRRIANWLEQAAGLRAGDFVAASLDNTWQFAACFFAVCELGGVLMPFDPRRPAAELSWFAARLPFRAVICDPASRLKWERVGDTLPSPRILTADDITGALRTSAPRSTRTAQRSGSDPALYLATSGSTGAPKVVPRSHANLLAGARNTGRALAVGPGRRFLSVAPFYHANGFTTACACR